MRVGHNLVFERLQFFAERLQNRIVAVNHRIEQRVREIAGSGTADDCTSLPDSITNWIENVATALLKCEHVVRANEQADLFRLNPFFTQQRHTRDAQRVLLETLYLGSLRHVDDVLQRQGMN